MKTEYLVLWIDDQPERIETDHDRLISLLEDNGIKPNINLYDPEEATKKEVLAKIHKNKHLHNPELDLILIDFSMPALTGEKIIKAIRKSENIYTPIIFYSQNNIKDLIAAAYAQMGEVDGVYFASRRMLFEKIQSVIGSLLIREHQIKMTRGLLMEEVSEIDAHLFKLISFYWKKNKNKTDIIKKFREKQLENSTSQLEKIKSIPKASKDFIKYILNPKNLDTSSRLRMLRSLIKDIEGDELRKAEPILKDLLPDNSTSLIRVRNDYAHQTRDELKQGHNATKCVQIRKEIRRQSENVISILPPKVKRR